MDNQIFQKIVKEGQSHLQDHDNLLFLEDNQKDKIVQYSPNAIFYRFNQLIGCGSYKSIYRGHDSDSGREVAWNVINLMKIPPEERKRITEQISILKNISHKKIINFIRAWKNKNQIIFITQMVSGGSLKKHINKIKKPRLKIIKGWCKQILEGLNYLHTLKPNPIIHRDIKCQNIFINTNTNEIRIGDLGLAISTKNSYAETLVGTAQFMAPQILEGKYSTGVDIYAFGMCVLEISTLETPYKQCKGLHQIIKNIENRIKPKSLELIESESLKKFIEKCLNQQKDRPSASELLEDAFFLPDQQQDNKQVKLKQTPVILQVPVQLEATLKHNVQFLKRNQSQNLQLYNMSLKTFENFKPSELTQLDIRISDPTLMQHEPEISSELRQRNKRTSLLLLQEESEYKINIYNDFKNFYRQYFRKSNLNFNQKSFQQISDVHINVIKELKKQYQNKTVLEFIGDSKYLVKEQSIKNNRSSSHYSSSLSQNKKILNISKDKYSQNLNQAVFQTKSLKQNKNQQINHWNWTNNMKSKDDNNNIQYENLKSKSKEKKQKPISAKPPLQNKNSFQIELDKNLMTAQQIKKSKKVEFDTSDTKLITPKQAIIQKQVKIQNENNIETHINQISNEENLKSEQNKIQIKVEITNNVNNLNNNVNNFNNVNNIKNIESQKINNNDSKLMEVKIDTNALKQFKIDYKSLNTINTVNTVNIINTVNNVKQNESIKHQRKVSTFIDQKNQIGKVLDIDFENKNQIHNTKKQQESNQNQKLKKQEQQQQEKIFDKFEVNSNSIKSQNIKSLVPNTEESRDSQLLQKLKKQNIKFPISKDQTPSKQIVMLIQNALSILLGEKIEAIGVFGHYTIQLVKKIQSQYRLRSDGIIDQITFNMMIDQLQKKLKPVQKQKQIKSQELERMQRIKREQKNRESEKLLSELENEIMQKQN